MTDDRTDKDDRRNIDGFGYPPAPGMQDATSMTVPALIIVAILVIGGYLVVKYDSDNIRTAASSTPAATTRPPSVPAQ